MLYNVDTSEEEKYPWGSDGDESHEKDEQGSNLGACGCTLAKVPGMLSNIII